MMEKRSAAGFEAMGSKTNEKIGGNVKRPFTTYVFCLIAVAISLVTFSVVYAQNETGTVNIPFIALVAASFLFGTAELEGACGSSHVSVLGTLYARGKDGKEKFLWIHAAALYTFGGLISAGMLGAVTGIVGQLFAFEPNFILLLFFALVLICSFRELGVLKFKLPQVHLQTNPGWSSEFGILPATFMWGLHIGIGYVTVIAHTGFYVVVFLSFMLGYKLGALLFICYWLGRAMPLWITPYSVSNIEFDMEAVMHLVHRSHTAYMCATLLGIALTAVSAIMIWAY